MKKIYLVLVLLGVSYLIKAQSHEEGNIVINVNAGFGLYGANYDAPNNEDDSNGPLAFGLFPLKIEYGIKDRVSVGIIYQPFSVKASVTDDNNVENSVKVKGSLIAPSIVYHFTPEAKTDFYVGFAPGYVGTTWTAKSDSNEEEAKLGGFGMKIDLGARFYFGGKVSLNLNLAYASYNTNLNSYKENGVAAENPEGKLKIKGFEPSIGLGFKI